MADGAKNYVMHVCKNALVTIDAKGNRKRITLASRAKPVCNVGFIDVDTNNAKQPPHWKYCPDCVSKGFKNPQRKPVDPKRAEQAKAMRGAKTKAKATIIKPAQQGLELLI